MDDGNERRRPTRFFILILIAIPTIVAIFTLQAFQASRDGPSTSATYSHGFLRLTIPYHAARAGAGKLTIEVLDPKTTWWAARSGALTQPRDRDGGKTTASWRESCR